MNSKTIAIRIQKPLQLEFKNHCNMNSKTIATWIQKPLQHEFKIIAIRIQARLVITFPRNAIAGIRQGVNAIDKLQASVIANPCNQLQRSKGLHWTSISSQWVGASFVAGDGNQDCKARINQFCQRGGGERGNEGQPIEGNEMDP